MFGGCGVVGTGCVDGVHGFGVECAEALAKFFHEMGAEPVTQPKLSVTATSLPVETMTVLLESRGKQV